MDHAVVSNCKSILTEVLKMTRWVLILCAQSAPCQRKSIGSAGFAETYWRFYGIPRIVSFEYTESLSIIP